MHSISYDSPAARASGAAAQPSSAGLHGSSTAGAVTNGSSSDHSTQNVSRQSASPTRVHCMAVPS